jgi:hypothetical protein
MNPDYENIGKVFVQQYYAMFDGGVQARVGIANFYSDTSLLTFEGHQFLGKAKIGEKLANLSFQKIEHVIEICDTQPTMDGGVVILVLGLLKTDDDPPHRFMQTFVLKAANGTFFVQHDLFRLCLSA